MCRRSCSAVAPADRSIAGCHGSANGAVTTPFAEPSGPRPSRDETGRRGPVRSERATSGSDRSGFEVGRQMMDTKRQSADAWGPYRPAVEDLVAACADYLDRVEYSLAGEIAPDRHYVNDKAYQLQEAARRLVRRVQDIERWLNACNADVQHDGVASGAECERPCGHDGPRDPDPPPALAEQLCQESRVLTDVTERRPTVSAGSLPPSTSAAPHWIRWNASTARRSMTSPRPSTALNAMRDAWRTGSVSANRRDERTRRAEDPIVARSRACRCRGQRSDRGQRGHRPAAQASHAQTTRRYRAARGLGTKELGDSVSAYTRPEEVCGDRSRDRRRWRRARSEGSGAGHRRGAGR